MSPARPSNTVRRRAPDTANSERAYTEIRSAIVENRYVPGQRLVEQHIAAEFQLSRTPVREALRRLEAEGLVVSERNRGAIVRRISVDDVVDLYELRARLESYAAELAAERITAEQLEVLRVGVSAFSDVRERMVDAAIEAVRDLSDANRSIHDTIVKAAHHQRLETMLTRTVDIPLVFSAFRTFGQQERQRSDLFHHLIAEAIASGDGARAGRLMTEHIRQGLDAVLSGIPETPAAT